MNYFALKFDASRLTGEDKEEMYDVKLSKDELHALLECLGELRSRFVEELDDPKSNSVFVAASGLHFKLAKLVYPDGDISLDDYLDI